MSANLTEKAMLVNFSVSSWQARKKDKKLESEIARMKNADQERISVNKYLLAKENLTEITDINFLYHSTNLVRENISI